MMLPLSFSLLSVKMQVVVSFYLLTSSGVHLYFLPKYSPELNPCELIFGFLKDHLRHWRDDSRFWLEIIKALSTISYWTVVKFYSHCLWYTLDDPDKFTELFRHL